MKTIDVLQWPLTLSCVAALLTFGCGDKRTASSLAPGERVALAVSTANGLRAGSVAVEGDEEDEKEGDEKETEGGPEDDVVEMGAAMRADVVSLTFTGTPALPGLRMSGRYLGGQQFAVTRTDAARTPRLRLVGRVQDVRPAGSGLVLIRLFDQDVLAAGTLTLKVVAHADDELDTEDDGVDCQQDGEHEGENEGC
jgi:hypothetical protein